MSNFMLLRNYAIHRYEKQYRRTNFHKIISILIDIHILIRIKHIYTTFIIIINVMFVRGWNKDYN